MPLIRFPKRRMLSTLEDMHWKLRQWEDRYAKEQSEDHSEERLLELRDAIVELDEIRHHLQYAIAALRNHQPA